MSTWSSLSESFYHSLLESQLNQRNNRRKDSYTLNNVVDTSCSNISLHRSSPKPSIYYKDYYFYIRDTLNSRNDLDKINQFSECKIPTSTVIHKSPGNHTSRRINNLLYSSGNIKNSLYTIPYESSQYTLSNVSIYSNYAVSKVNLFSELQRELINSTDSVYLYDNNSKNDLKHVVIKPSGVLNAGIMGLQIDVKPVDDSLVVSTKELLTVYPSCFFYHVQKNSNYFMDPYVESKKSHKVECTWDGYSVKSKIYSQKNKAGIVHEDLDILELKAENLSIYSSTIYARNPLGISVFRYYFDYNNDTIIDEGGEWRLKLINNVSFSAVEKIYYMCLSPYVSNDAIFLKTTNVMLIYDGFKGHERDTISLSSLINPNKDIIQTVSYGMDNNSLILGGNKLYHYDRRSNSLTDLILPLRSSITVTRVKWTERKYDYEYPSHHYKHYLSGRSCSFSNYFRNSNPSFWGSFTACEVHPVYNYILAVVCGISDCILLFDLRIPNSPLIDIPLPSTKFIGSRFRSLRWYFVDEVSYLFAFSWRNKLPVVARFVIDSSFNSYSQLENPKVSVEDFENVDKSYDTLIKFDRCRFLNFSNSEQSQEDHNFPSFGTSIKSENYFDLPLQFTNENAMTDIFHGYLGLTHLHFKKQNVRLGLAYTTSGRLMCLDMDNRNVLKNNAENDKEKTQKGHSQIDLEDDTNSFVGFEIKCNNVSGIPVPTHIKFDEGFKYILVKKTTFQKLYTDYTADDLNENFVKMQEQHFADEKMYSSVSVNSTHANEENIKAFNSREILKTILEFKRSKDSESHDNKQPVISKTKFDKMYGKENIKLYNTWNPLDSRLYEEFVEDTNDESHKSDKQLCSCSTIDELINDYRRRINQNVDSNTKDVNTNNNNNNNNNDGTMLDSVNNKEINNGNLNENQNRNQIQDLNVNLNEINIDVLEKLLHHSIDKDNSSNENVNMNNQDESLVFDKGVVETFGDMIMKSTNIDVGLLTTGSENRRNDESKDTKHRDDCRINDLIFVEVEKDSDDTDYHPLVEEIMSTWIVNK